MTVPMPARNSVEEAVALAASSLMKRRCLETWPAAPLGSMATISSGGTPDTQNPAFWDGDVVWVTPRDLGKPRNIEVDRSERRLSSAAVSSSAARVVPEGSVILSTRAPIGHLAIAGVPLATNQGCKNITCAGDLQPRFLFHILRGSIEELQAAGRGNTFPEIPARVVKELSIPVPPVEAQAEIAEFLEALYRLLGGETLALPVLGSLPSAVTEAVLAAEAAARVRRLHEEVAPLLNALPLSLLSHEME